jgi:hypothetical protein
VRGNSHARFLGEEAVVTLLSYPTLMFRVVSPPLLWGLGLQPKEGDSASNVAVGDAIRIIIRSHDFALCVD